MESAGDHVNPEQEQDQCAGQTSLPLSKKRRVACAECRQSKVKCDASQGPCSRCRRLKLKCETLSGYKRVDRRSKMEEIEHELKHLKSMVNSNDRPHTAESSRPFNSMSDIQTTSVPRIPEGPLTPTYNGTTNGIPDPEPTIQRQGQILVNGTSILGPKNPVPNPSVASPPFSNTTSSMATRTPRAIAASPRSLDTVHLTTSQIDSLFNLFYDNYHPYLPFLDPSISPDECYESSPLLFWSIISVGGRRYCEIPSLPDTLSKPVTSLIWSAIEEPPLLRVGIQALLLICLWPFPSTNILKPEPSLNFVTLAVNGAMQVGLHRPEFSLEYGVARRPGKRSLTEREKREATLTWAACNIVAQHVLGQNGHPSPICLFDWSIDRACEVGTSYTLSEDIRHHLIIQKIAFRIQKAMSGNNADPTALPPENERYVLLSVFEADIDDAEGQFGRQISMINQLYVWTARLHLYTYYFYQSSLAETRRLGILKAYSAALTLINKIDAGDTLFEVLRHSPSYIFRALFSAAAVLIKVVHSTFSRYVDTAVGEQVFNTAVSAVRRWSIAKNDKAFRAAEMLTQMWPMFLESYMTTPEEPTLRFKSRLNTSILYDIIVHWRQYMEARGLLNQANEPGSNPNETSLASGGAAGQQQNPNSNSGVQSDPTTNNIDLGIDDGSLILPWDDLRALTFDWDWDLHGFMLPASS